MARDTVAIQAAIDACTAGGGGRVLVPPGCCVTGTLRLRNHNGLQLLPGAVLKGSPNREDYNADDAFPENEVFSRENFTGAHLVIAREVGEVSISGRGAIDGSSSRFVADLPPDRLANGYRHKSCNFPIGRWRPGQMVFFFSCRRVSVIDVQLLNAPDWPLFCLGCDDISIRGLTIVNPPQTANGDGIDIDCCRDVTISDCRIVWGDDCIILRGSPRLLAGPRPCESVTVSNCVLSTPCNTIRVSVGDGEVRNCVLSNIVVSDTRTAISMVCPYAGPARWGGSGETRWPSVTPAGCRSGTRFCRRRVRAARGRV
ncbi:MAG: hypothetical protein JXR77_19585 [Lentisphaeria bacterium]|nr:hypothetical protein [Lentisphaeria bacterium]